MVLIGTVKGRGQPRLEGADDTPPESEPIQSSAKNCCKLMGIGVYHSAHLIHHEWREPPSNGGVITVEPMLKNQKSHR